MTLPIFENIQLPSKKTDVSKFTAGLCDLGFTVRPVKSFHTFAILQKVVERRSQVRFSSQMRLNAFTNSAVCLKRDKFLHKFTGHSVKFAISYRLN